MVVFNAWSIYSKSGFKGSNKTARNVTLKPFQDSNRGVLTSALHCTGTISYGGFLSYLVGTETSFFIAKLTVPSLDKSYPNEKIKNSYEFKTLKPRYVFKVYLNLFGLLMVYWRVVGTEKNTNIFSSTNKTTINSE